MHLTNACLAILKQLSDLVGQLNDADFTKPSKALSHSTLGQHLRHTIEFFICLEEGYQRGVVNYDKRSHDKLIETDRFIALDNLSRMHDFISLQQNDRPLQLEVSYHANDECCITIATNYWRELTYNIEHAVHHMAIMKIGVNEVAPHIVLPSDFGVAVSTIRYKKEGTLAQADR